VRRRIAELERKIGEQQGDLDFFSASLAACEGKTAGGRGVWQAAVFEVIGAMTVSQGSLKIQRLWPVGRGEPGGLLPVLAEECTAAHDTAVQSAIQRVALAHGRRHGYRYITHQLRRENGIVVNHKRVLRLMRQDNLLCLRKRAFVPQTTDSLHDWEIVANLARGLRLTGLDQLWVADITYIRLQEEFAYLAVILDAFSRRVIGWALADHLRASLAIEALEMAIEARRRQPDPSLRPRRASMPVATTPSCSRHTTLPPA
jgi:hypothetical protein